MTARQATKGPMGHLARFALVALAISGSMAIRPTALSAQSPATKTLLGLEDAWAQGLVRRDTAMFRQHLAPNFVYTEDAAVMGKEEVLKGVIGPDTVTAASNEGMQVHLYGRTAVVTGILAVKGRGKAGSFDKRYRFTDTWMFFGGQWQIIAAQDYLIPKK